MSTADGGRAEVSASGAGRQYEPDGPRRVLVTGAGGFIGGRIVEYLNEAGYEPRAGLRKWSNAARVARRTVELTLCDVLEPTEIQAAMDGVDAVVHCAAGGGDVIVEGTQNVLEEAARRDLGRVVHLSTVEVYGGREGDVPEQSPLEKTGNPYGDAKVEAERLCRQFADTGLPLAVLRPTIVYGPFSDLWTVRLARQLRAKGQIVPRDGGEGICNLVYVDDVARLVELCLVRPEAVGEAFNANGAERVQWHEYLEALRESLGISEMRTEGRAATKLRALALSPIRSAASFAMDRFGDLAMELYKRNRIAQSVMKGVEATLKSTPTPNQLDLYERKAFYPIDKARDLLGYEPRFGMGLGVQRSVEWLRHHGVLEAT